VLSGRGLCDELITLPEESYRLRSVDVSDLETSWMRRPWLTGGCCARRRRRKRRRLPLVFCTTKVGPHLLSSPNADVWARHTYFPVISNNY
jgi:hypothetical protein